MSSGRVETRFSKPSANHPFCCDKCPGSFTRKEHLLRHYRTHENVKPFECSACSQGFGRKDLRDRHERNVHQIIRPTIVRQLSDGLPSLPAEKRSSPARSPVTSISADTQRQCLELFFKCFAATMPLIHRPTFNPDKRGSGLIRSMIAVGGSYSADSDTRILARRILREEWSSMRQLFVTLAIDDPRSFDVVSEVLILSFFSLSHLDQLQFEDSRDVLHEAIQFGRNFGMDRPLVSTAFRPPETLHQRWLEWVKYESFKRLSLLYLITDALMACIFNSAPRMSFLEVRQNMPVDELIWNAQTAEVWQNACLSTAANTESPMVDAVHHLLNSYHVPPNLNELSSILLSTCMMSSVGELSSWKVLYSTRNRPTSRRRQQERQEPFGVETFYGQEVSAREAQLKCGLDVLLERARHQRLGSAAPSPMWDVASTIQQLSYLRLYLPSAQTTHGIVTSNWRTAMDETMLAVVSEDLGKIDYRLITLLLSWFIELILSEVHLQYQHSSQTRENNHLSTEATVSCVACVEAMIDMWRLVRYTALHEAEISQSPELSLARAGFLGTVRELSESVLGPSDRASAAVCPDEFARALSQLCANMYQLTTMGTSQLAAMMFGKLVVVLQQGGSANCKGMVRPGPHAQVGAWEMISRCF